MSIKINYLNKKNNKSLTNLLLFTDDNFNINPLKKHLFPLFSYYNNEIYYLL